jgi:hypothetical protein
MIDECHELPFSLPVPLGLGHDTRIILRSRITTNLIISKLVFVAMFLPLPWGGDSGVNMCLTFSLIYLTLPEVRGLVPLDLYSGIC